MEPTIGERLRAARQARGLSQQKLAGLLGRSQPHLSAIESGKKQPTLALLQEIAAAYGCPVSELIEGPREAA